MAEYIYNPVQEVAAGQNVLLNDSIPCNRGLVLHRNGSGILTLRGPSGGTCNKFARYQVTFVANIAIPTGAASVDPISISLALNGEAIQTSKAIASPVDVNTYYNVTSTAIINIPSACCETIAVENTSTSAINVQNANLVISRLA